MQLNPCYLPPRPLDLTLPTVDSPTVTVFPQVVLGDAFTGLGGDSTRIAFAKFNVHTHAEASHANFADVNIAAGDVVTVRPLQNSTEASPVLLPGTVVVEITSSRVVLSAAAQEDAFGTLIGPNGTATNCQFTRNSTLVHRLATAGYLPPFVYEAALKRTLTWSHPQPSLVERYALYLGGNTSIRLGMLSTFASVGVGSLRLFTETFLTDSVNAIGPTPERSFLNVVVPPLTPIYIQVTSSDSMRGCHVEVEATILH